MTIKKLFEDNPYEKEMCKMMRKIGIRHFDGKRPEYTLFNNAVRDFLVDRCNFAVRREGEVSGSGYAYRIVSLETEFLRKEVEGLKKEIKKLKKYETRKKENRK